MLVLSRKKNESIIINDHITVTVVEIRGDKVRLGIDAPKDVTVHRREVYEAIQNQLKDRPVETRAACRHPGRRPRLIRTRSLLHADQRFRAPSGQRTNSRIQGPLSGQPRTVTSGPSTTTSRLTNSAPRGPHVGFQLGVSGQRLAPSAPPAAMTSSGPWQLAAIGLPASTKWRVIGDRFRPVAEIFRSPAAGQDQGVVARRVDLIDRQVGGSTR